MQTIELPKVIDFASSLALACEIETRFNAACPVTLHASEVEQCDAAALTMLWQAAERYQSAGLDLFLDSPSLYFLNALANTPQLPTPEPDKVP